MKYLCWTDSPKGGVIEVQQEHVHVIIKVQQEHVHVISNKINKYM